MNYIKQINGFWNWRMLNRISHGEADLYYAILHCANAAKWKLRFNIPNSTLLKLAHFADNSSLIKTRNKLIQNGLIEYQKSKDGQAGIYKIKCLYDMTLDTEMDTTLDTEMDTTLDTEMDTIHIQNKNKTKRNIITPNPFKGEMAKKFDEWLAYKKERGQAYKSTGLKALITKIQNGIKDYGESRVISEIDNSISNNWHGLFFDNIANSKPEKFLDIYNPEIDYDAIAELSQKKGI